MSSNDPPMLDVDVPPDVTEAAAEMADRQNIAIEDALARLTAWNYPVEKVPKRTESTGGFSGP